MYEGKGRKQSFDGRAAFFFFILELGTIKDDFVALQEKAVADREAMEAEFDASGNTLFNYGYGCCVFTHNICGSKSQIPDGMPDRFVPLTPEFFANPRCPPSTSSAAAASDPTVVSREERSETSPTAVREEASLLAVRVCMDFC